MARLHGLAQVLQLTWSNWLSHDAPRFGAAIAFYALLSLAPLVVLSISVASIFFSGTSTEEHVVRDVQALAGTEAAKVVEALAQQARQPSSEALADFAGVITLLLGASGVFAELRVALNTMWDIPTAGSGGILVLVKERLFSIGMVLAIGFLLVVSLILSALLGLVSKFFGSLPMPLPLLHLLNFVISFGGIAIMFALILRYVPDARLPWQDVWIGGAVNALLFTVGKSLIGLYLGSAAVGSLYGAGGSIVVVTVWVYYSAQLFLFGAEFTQVWSERRTASAVVPAPQLAVQRF